MNGKETKVPIYIAIVVALILIAAGGYFIMGGKSVEKLPGDVKKTPVPTARVTPAVAATTVEAKTNTAVEAKTAATAATPAIPAATKAETVKCELCHKNAKELYPHVNGGKLCINCHGSQVHNIHIGAGTVNLDCATCHGNPPKIPTVEKGEGPGHYAVCEKCHAPPPDSLKPSNGNLIMIHLSRSKYCTNCHGTDIGTIHEAKLSNASKR